LQKNLEFYLLLLYCYLVFKNFFIFFPIHSFDCHTTLKSIHKTLLTLIIAIITFLIIMGLLSFKILGSALRNQAKNHLVSVREIKKTQIQNFFRERYGDINILSKSPLIMQSLPAFASAFKEGGFDNPLYKQTEKDYGYLFVHFMTQHGYQNIYLADEEGFLVYGVKKDTLLGVNLKSRDFISAKINEVFSEGLTRLNFSDLTFNTKTKDFMCLGASPVYDNTNTLLGVVIVEISYSKLDTIVSQWDGLGKTGEIYIIGEDKLMRSKSRFLKENTILKKEIDTKASRDVLKGNTYIQLVKDYRNLPVLSAYTPLDGLRDVKWYLLVEIDEKEVLHPFGVLESYLVVIAAAIIIISIAFHLITRKKSPGIKFLPPSSSNSINEG